MKPVCLITGGSGRLGTALCKALIDTHEVVAQYRSRVPLLPSQFHRHLGSRPVTKAEEDRSSIYYVQADLLNREDLRRLVDVSLARFDRIDQVINCVADVKFHGRLLELSQSSNYPLDQLNINCVAPIRLVSAIHDRFWKDCCDDNAKLNRSVVNVSSGSAFIAFKDTRQAYYGASKSALNLLTMYLAAELAPYSVRANAICPGKFTSDEEMAHVVAGIRSMLSGHRTGEIDTLFDLSD
jgi:NAD(P)-dependent dehydrogenase (short-subunit alcohol dehydrogenase family)